jgi:type IV pilus biogenesis protein PilP
MRAISRIAVLAALVSGGVFADPTVAPTQLFQPPVSVANPPAPVELAPLSPDFQADMANSQLQTYRYGQLAAQALALKKLCDTGFGPADLCPSARTGGADDAILTGGPELPTVTGIDGIRGDLTAVLVLADGRKVTVRPGSVLPGGLTIAAITGEDVRVRTQSGQQTSLVFGERGQAR